MLLPMILLLLTTVLTARFVRQWLKILANSAPSVPIFKLSNKWKLGRAHLDFVNDLSGLLAKGRERFKGNIFQIWGSPGYIVVLPPKYVSELKNLPEDQLSFDERSDMDMMYSVSATNVNAAIKTVLKRTITPQLSMLLSPIMEEIRQSLKLLMPQCQEWTNVQMYPILIRIATISLGHVFVGAPLNATNTYIRLTNTYTNQLLNAVNKLQAYHPLLVCLIAPFHPTVRKLRQIEREFAEVLVSHWGYDKDSSHNLSGWLRALGGRKSSKLTLVEIARGVLLTNFDANISASEILNQALVDLTIQTEYMDILRTEVEEVNKIAAAKDLSDLQRISLLVKVDSFIQESQRLHPITIVGFSRRTKTQVVLSDGTTLGPGTNISVPVALLMRDPQVWGPTADDFDGFRFLTNENKLSQPLSAVREGIWTFGQGVHACPGRYLATALVKFIFAEIIINYDIRGTEASEIKGLNNAFTKNESSLLTGANKAEIQNNGVFLFSDPDAIILQFKEKGL